MLVILLHLLLSPQELQLVYLDCLVVVYHFIKMKLQNINAKPIRKYILKDYRLVYKGRADDYAYLTIEKCDGSVVPLGVFEISYFDLEVYEGYPIFYKKIYLPLQIGEKNKKALIYIMNEDFDYHLPTNHYIEICKEGYNDFGFDKQN